MIYWTMVLEVWVPHCAVCLLHILLYYCTLQDDHSYSCCVTVSRGQWWPSTGAPQGTVLALFLFALYRLNFKYNPECRHVLKYSDDTAIMLHMRNRQGEEHRDLTVTFSEVTTTGPLWTPPRELLTFGGPVPRLGLCLAVWTASDSGLTLDYLIILLLLFFIH